jgi:hypothetical protein
MQIDDENQLITIVLKPNYFGYLELESNIFIISLAKLPKIPKVRFYDIFVEKVAIIGKSDQD